MKVDLDGKSIEVTVFEHRKNNYEYFIGNVQIGEIDTNVVKYVIKITPLWLNP